MTNAKSKNPPQNLARLTGFLYLLLGVVGIFGLLVVPSQLFVPDDAVATTNNILASEGLFRAGIFGRLMTQTIQILTVVALYQLLKSVNKTQAALMTIFILVGVPIAMLTEITQIAALLLLKNPTLAGLFTVEQIQSMAALLLELHNYGIMIAQIFWGLWLLPMGYLVFKSGFIPRILGILLIIGCFGYLIDVVIVLLMPTVDLTVSQFTFFGEILLPLWLVVKGVKTEKLQESYALTQPAVS